MPKWEIATDKSPKVGRLAQTCCREDWLGNSPLPALLLFSFSPLQCTWKAQYSEWLIAITAFLASSPSHPFCPMYGEGKEQGTFTGCLLWCACCLQHPEVWQVQAPSAPRALHGALHHCKQIHAHNSSKNGKQKCSNLAATILHPFTQYFYTWLCRLRWRPLLFFNSFCSRRSSKWLLTFLEELKLFNLSVLPHRSRWPKQDVHCLSALSKASLSTAPRAALLFAHPAFCLLTLLSLLSLPW